MILPDVNVLVRAHNADSTVHERAKLWWDACLSGTEGIGLAWATMLGFLRITESWLALPHVHIAQPSDTHFERLRAELERLGTAGNLTTDTHLAVLAIERGYILHSTDTDFARFRGLRWVNPCQETPRS